MKIDASKFLDDPEANFFCRYFDEPVCKILEVGANDCNISVLLAEAGFDVTTIDLRDYQFPHAHKHLKCNFLELPNSFWAEFKSSFDVVFSVSAIEHFGLGTYKEKPSFEFADVIAVRYMFDLLKPGGRCYLVIPYGGRFFKMGHHWRVYDWASVHDRFIQDFRLDWHAVQVSEAFSCYKPCENVSDRVPLTLMNGEPYCSIMLKMTKI